MDDLWDAEETNPTPATGGGGRPPLATRMRPRTLDEYAGQRHVPYAMVSDQAADQAITAVSASKAWNLAGLKCAQLLFTRQDDGRWSEGLLYP